MFLMKDLHDGLHVLPTARRTNDPTNVRTDTGTYCAVLSFCSPLIVFSPLGSLIQVFYYSILCLLQCLFLHQKYENKKTEKEMDKKYDKRKIEEAERGDNLYQKLFIQLSQ